MRIALPGPGMFLPAVLVLTLFSCHSTDHPAASGDTTTTARVYTARVYDRATLIQALKELRGRILSGDKVQTGGIFTFPIPDSVFYITLGDTAFDRREDRGAVITQAMFYANFEKIDRALDLDQFRKLFVHLNLDSLLTNNQIEYDTAIGSEVCGKQYVIRIEHDSLVSLTYGINTRKDYVPPKVKDTVDKDVDADDPCGSTGTDWEFIFDGKKLLFMAKSGYG